ncbi:maleylpyruvate isomerase family mycothiol-dependent enzyme [Streptomyces cyaneofuscatus]|uniref:maleylpyruvate isomerase family mycothiol-dependent enzyme n=1 Tax=Streptomyces TaxID=1883 RepID=UPI002E14B371|nr:maleylpyruvate isomerase family mycothiol-dependent enzyme [Streptomyces cyaneofuscatus]WTF36208.1 maleylpyruvate isomerase family mycothiol-dependent enzyme [Streptomyces cyaneofuscatus]
MTSAPVRDPELPGLLLRTERDVFLPLLRATPESAYALRTACPGWTVRDVLAHCAAALTRVVEDRLEKGVFSPESNERDIEERAGLPLPALLDELERGMTEAGPVIAAAGGKLDGVALGEWVHAGDVREAWGLDGAYAGRGLAYALGLLEGVAYRKEMPRIVADVEGDGAGWGAPRPLGVPSPEGRPAGRYHGDGPTLIRLYANRPLVGTRYELHGVHEGDLHLFDRPPKLDD